VEVWVRIEESGGPGLELTHEPGRGVVVSGVRRGVSWLGLDRGSIVETDVGDGSALAAVVALPHSAPSSSWLRAELAGAFQEGDRAVIITAMPGHRVPIPALVRVAARIGADVPQLTAPQAERLVTRSRHRYRRRRAAGRRTDQPAWLPSGIGSGAIGGASYSRAERDLAKLPPRFVRGLADLLDDDERILASVERPAEPDAGLLPWRRRERRAALLVLTDRQLVWLVDHVPPDRYLFDWGVDATLLALEALTAADATVVSGLTLRIGGGEVRFAVPAEARRDIVALMGRLAPFLPPNGGTAVRRHYPLQPLNFVTETLQPYRQADEAAARLGRLEASAGTKLLASFYAPRRERVRRAVAVALTEENVMVDDERGCRQLALSSLRSIDLALSPLIGRIALDAGAQRASFSYPAPLGAPAAAFVRQLRRAWANA
jgi:hypothetical protein